MLQNDTRDWHKLSWLPWHFYIVKEEKILYLLFTLKRERERERDAFMKNGSNFVSHSVSILAQAQEAILSNGYKRISFFIFSYPIKYGQHLGKWTYFMKFSFNDKI